MCGSSSGRNFAQLIDQQQREVAQSGDRMTLRSGAFNKKVSPWYQGKQPLTIAQVARSRTVAAGSPVPKMT